MGRAGQRGGRLGEVWSFIGALYGPDLHAKRIDALAGATLGVMAAASLAVALIGQALARARGLVTRHAVKQVDRLLSNNGIDAWDSFPGELGLGYVIGFRGNIRVTAEDGETKPAAAGVGKGGCARKLRQYRVTAQGRQVGAVVCVQAKRMKEPLCLGSSDPEATAAMLVNHDGRC